MRRPHPERAVISLLRVCKAGFFNFFRSWWLSTAAVAIMLVTLVLVTSTIIFNRALNDTLVENSKNLTVSVYLQDDINESLRSDLQQELENDSNVREVTYVSKQEAQQAYVEQNEENQELLDAIGIVGNQFPASFEAQLVDLTQNETFIETVNEEKYQPIVEDYDQGRLDTVNSIGTVQDNIIRGGVVAGIIFTAISVLIIFNTIRMAIFTRRDEIHMMKLIGATNNYIRGPFLFESALYGIIAGGVTLSLLRFIVPQLDSSLENSRIVFGPTVELITQNFLLVGAATIGFGVLLGIISSMLAMGRYLRLQ